MNVTSIVCSCFVLFQSYAQFMQNRCIYGVTTAYMESSCIEPCKLGRRSRVWPQSWFMSLAWFPLRGTIRASNGFNLLKKITPQLLVTDQEKKRTHTVTPPLAQPNSGRISFPVTESIAGKISKTERMLAMTSHALASARKRPGQILQRIRQRCITCL